MNSWAIPAGMNPAKDTGMRPEDTSYTGSKIFREDSLRGMMEREFVAASFDLVRTGARQNMRVLELGCGTGHFTVLLARLGCQVVAVDSVDAAVRSAEARCGKSSGIHVFKKGEETCTAGFGSSEFDLVTALRVIPWHTDPAEIFREAFRVLKPGGQLVIAVRNYLSLQMLVDPVTNPWSGPLWHRCKMLLASSGMRRTFIPRFPRFHSRREIRDLLDIHGFDVLAERCVGFGPLTLFGRRVVPDSVGMHLERIAAGCAERIPVLRRRGTHLLILAEKRKDNSGGGS